MQIFKCDFVKFCLLLYLIDSSIFFFIIPGYVCDLGRKLQFENLSFLNVFCRLTLDYNSKGIFNIESCPCKDYRRHNETFTCDFKSPLW